MLCCAGALRWRQALCSFEFTIYCAKQKNHATNRRLDVAIRRLDVEEIVTATMKGISEERLDAAIHRLDEEDVAEERRLDAAIRRLDEEEMMEHARQQKKEQEEHARQQKKEQEEHARQQKKERENEARQRKEEQEEQAPKARGKYITFDDRIEDLKQFKETHGHANVTILAANSATK